MIAKYSNFDAFEYDRKYITVLVHKSNNYCLRNNFAKTPCQVAKTLGSSWLLDLFKEAMRTNVERKVKELAFLLDKNLSKTGKKKLNPYIVRTIYRYIEG